MVEADDATTLRAEQGASGAGTTIARARPASGRLLPVTRGRAAWSPRLQASALESCIETIGETTCTPFGEAVCSPPALIVTASRRLPPKDSCPCTSPQTCDVDYIDLAYRIRPDATSQAARSPRPCLGAAPGRGDCVGDRTMRGMRVRPVGDIKTRGRRGGPRHSRLLVRWLLGRGAKLGGSKHDAVEVINGEGPG